MGLASIWSGAGKGSNWSRLVFVVTIVAPRAGRDAATLEFRAEPGADVTCELLGGITALKSPELISFLLHEKDWTMLLLLKILDSWEK